MGGTRDARRGCWIHLLWISILAAPARPALAGVLEDTALTHSDAIRLLAGQECRLKDLTLSLREDKDIVIAAARAHGHSLGHAGCEHRRDRDVVLAAVSNNGLALRHAHLSLRDDYDVVFAAVGNRGPAIRYASDRLRSDGRVQKVAIFSDACSVRFFLQHAFIEEENTGSNASTDGSKGSDAQ